MRYYTHNHGVLSLRNLEDQSDIHTLVTPKNMRNLFILPRLIFFAACSPEQPDLILKGVLGKDLNSQFILLQKGDRYEGYFFYETTSNERIPILGTKVGQTLRLEEFNNNEQKLTGVFTGTFDGETYEGNWTDPEGNKAVAFAYHLDKSQVAQDSGVETTTKIDYQLFGQDNYRDAFYHGLKATISGQDYVIVEPAEEDEQWCFLRLHVVDFDGDGWEDALIEWHSLCGGNAQPFLELLFCRYESKSDRFTILESSEIMFSGEPIIKPWRQGAMVEITVKGGLSRSIEQYTIKDGKIVQLSTVDIAPLVALVEIRPEDFNQNQRRFDYEKIVQFDLNYDGTKEEIRAGYVERWSAIGGSVHSADGEVLATTGGSVYRFGVLPSKTKGYHDLVVGVDQVLVWNGNKYVEKNE